MKKTKKCKTCNNCKRVYDKGLYRYFRWNWHYCTKREEVTELKNGCEEWEKRKTEYDLSPQRFDEVENDIKIITALLKDK